MPEVPPLRPAQLKTRVAQRLGWGPARGRLDLSLAVVSYNQWPVSRAFIQSMGYPQAPPRSELIWVDNASTDGSAQKLAAMDWSGLGGFQRVTLLRLKRNYFISGAVNVALAHARGRYFIQADNDVLFAPGSLAAYLRALRDRPDALLSPLWQRTQGLLPRDYEPACYDNLPQAWERLRRVNALLRPENGVAAGSCWGADARLLRALGGWSEDFRLQCMDNDCTLRWRRSGRPAGMLPLPVFHPGLKTRRADRRASTWELEDAALYRARWPGGAFDDLKAPPPALNRLLGSPLAKILRALHLF